MVATVETSLVEEIDWTVVQDLRIGNCLPLYHGFKSHTYIIYVSQAGEGKLYFLHGQLRDLC